MSSFSLFSRREHNFTCLAPPPPPPPTPHTMLKTKTCNIVLFVLQGGGNSNAIFYTVQFLAPSYLFGSNCKQWENSQSTKILRLKSKNVGNENNNCPIDNNLTFYLQTTLHT